MEKYRFGQGITTGLGKQSKVEITDKKKIHVKGEYDARAGHKEDLFIKGARTTTGTYNPESDITAEKGKKIAYEQNRPDPIKHTDEKGNVTYGSNLFKDPVYTKEVYKKKKGSATGEETWELKRSKEISTKKYKRQIERKSKRYN